MMRRMAFDMVPAISKKKTLMRGELKRAGLNDDHLPEIIRSAVRGAGENEKVNSDSPVRF